MNDTDIRNYTYPEGENVVIAKLLQNKEVDDILLKCLPHFFFSEARRNIYQICKDYATTNGQGEVHYKAVTDSLRAMGKFDDKKSEFLEKLRNLNTCDYDIKYVINRLRDESTKRMLVVTFKEKLTEISNPSKDIDTILADVEEKITAIGRADRNALEVITPSQIYDRRGIGIKERYLTKPMYSGWELFDKRLSVGFAPGKTSVIAGRTSMGKSFFKTNLIESMCSRGIGVMNVCPEQGFDSEHDRIDAILTGIHLRSIARLREWEADNPKFELLKNASHRVASWNYTNVPNRKLSVAQIRTAIKKARASGVPVDIVFIDLFDRLDDVNVARERTSVIQTKLGEIDMIAKEEQVHICLLVQINRTVEGRRDKRPTMAELKGSGDYEQNSDLILLLYREGYYNTEIDDNILEVNIAKQRDGQMNIWFQFLIADRETLKIIPIGEKESNDAD